MPSKRRETARKKVRGSGTTEEIEDRIDYLESEASPADGEPIPAVQMWKRLGLCE